MKRRTFLVRCLEGACVGLALSLGVRPDIEEDYLSVARFPREDVLAAFRIPEELIVRTPADPRDVLRRMWIYGECWLES